MAAYPEFIGKGTMVLIIFLLLLLFMVVSVNGSILVMQVRLSKRSTSRKGLTWWMTRGSDEIGEMYEQVYPDSYLPLVPKLGFWFFLISAVTVFAVSLWK